MTLSREAFHPMNTSQREKAQVLRFDTWLPYVISSVRIHNIPNKQVRPSSELVALLPWESSSDQLNEGSDRKDVSSVRLVAQVTDVFHFTDSELDADAVISASDGIVILKTIFGEEFRVKTTFQYTGLARALEREIPELLQFVLMKYLLIRQAETIFAQRADAQPDRSPSNAVASVSPVIRRPSFVQPPASAHGGESASASTSTEALLHSIAPGAMDIEFARDLVSFVNPLLQLCAGSTLVDLIKEFKVAAADLQFPKDPAIRRKAFSRFTFQGTTASGMDAEAMLELLKSENLADALHMTTLSNKFRESLVEAFSIMARSSATTSKTSGKNKESKADTSTLAKPLADIMPRVHAMIAAVTIMFWHPRGFEERPKGARQAARIAATGFGALAAFLGGVVGGALMTVSSPIWAPVAIARTVREQRELGKKDTQELSEGGLMALGYAANVLVGGLPAMAVITYELYESLPKDWATRKDVGAGLGVDCHRRRLNEFCVKVLGMAKPPSTLTAEEELYTLFKQSNLNLTVAPHMFLSALQAIASFVDNTAAEVSPQPSAAQKQLARVYAYMHSDLKDYDEMLRYAAWMQGIGLIGYIRNLVSSSFLIGVYGPARQGKSTALKYIFGARTNAGGDDSSRTLSLAMFSAGVPGLSIMDMPGANESDHIVRSVTAYGAHVLNMFIVVLNMNTAHDESSKNDLQPIVAALNAGFPIIILLNSADIFLKNLPNPLAFEAEANIRRQLVVENLVSIGAPTTLRIRQEGRDAAGQAIRSAIVRPSLLEIVRPACMGIDEPSMLGGTRKIGDAEFNFLQQFIERDVVWTPLRVRRWIADNLPAAIGEKLRSVLAPTQLQGPRTVPVVAPLSVPVTPSVAATVATTTQAAAPAPQPSAQFTLTGAISAILDDLLSTGQLSEDEYYDAMDAVREDLEQGGVWSLQLQTARPDMRKGFVQRRLKAIAAAKKP